MDVSNKMTGQVVLLTQKPSAQAIQSDKLMTKDWQPEMALYAETSSQLSEELE